jgi:hypothetical protein
VQQAQPGARLQLQGTLLLLLLLLLRTGVRYTPAAHS